MFGDVNKELSKEIGPKSFIHKLDIVYIGLRAVLRPFFRTKLVKWQYKFVFDNIRKHRIIIWINLLFTPIIVLGLRAIEPSQISTIITALIAPAMVTGGAWFTITFGGIPSKLLGTALIITAWMFGAFTLSMRLMMTAIMFISPVYFWPVFILIELGVIVSAILYDNADGLKIGLDDTVLRHSRAAIQYYTQEGITVSEDRDADFIPEGQ